MKQPISVLISLILPFIASLGIADAHEGGVMPGPQVNTKYGIVEGSKEQDLNVFKGIPFAKPPTGELRWCPPQPPENWDGVRSCTEFSAVCTQETFPEMLDIKIMEVTGPQSEDCLYLNVWSQDDVDEKRPVMFWIHGGGLGLGAASQPLYDGQHLARKGVVVVTLPRVGENRPFLYTNIQL